jgi:hypothetical protein
MAIRVGRIVGFPGQIMTQMVEFLLPHHEDPDQARYEIWKKSNYEDLILHDH